MSITFPDWWQGGYPNIENLLKGFLAPRLGPDIEPTYWLPPPDKYQAHLQAGKGYLRIYRTGGRINREQKRDEPKVQFAALTPSRDDSWELCEIIRQIGEEFDKAAVVPGTPHQLHCTGEVIGPQLIPELLQDSRLVPVTLEFHTWKPRDFKYRQALGL
ncbi:hypothetical protein [Arthrobacter sp. SLBN-53]|uniref:phage tail termination protein n=1 Tax=Arthrobacter sp. SLBN-53 TaxID=2768412 RepID=UPI00114F5ED0|nr:hypothetical protein [Arthrobacter sp. SLBN-53]TQK29379.1 hypothetical protein FBY28_2382 [Arthrobacter sp. SLBN-53]